MPFLQSMLFWGRKKTSTLLLFPHSVGPFHHFISLYDAYSALFIPSSQKQLNSLSLFCSLLPHANQEFYWFQLFTPLASDPSHYPAHYNMTTQSNIPTFQLQKFSNQFYVFPNSPQVLLPDFSPQSSCISISNSTTSDEADEQQQCLINEKKNRRMISNRESARRSRTRKQKHLDELWSQVVWLRNENQQLIDKLNHVSESHNKVLQENAQLKGETSELRQMLCDMQLQSPCDAFP
ncbi:hypothetical protein RIF29_14295 [Crotalaria pallida]|uniref:BZIP domain-containing protein n=1 Tax=Crotalaria pallida TaxID=3830 RepID=A0AAN9FDL7_CROPI